MFTKKDITFKFNASDRSWTLSAGRWSQTSHFGIARPSQKPNRDTQDQFLAFVNREARNDAQAWEAENQRQAFKEARLDEAVKALGSLVNDEGKRPLPWGVSQTRL